jgi:hypothetical protein
MPMVANPRCSPPVTRGLDACAHLPGQRLAAIEAYVARVGVQVGSRLLRREEGFRSLLFSAKSTSFYAGKIWLSHPIRPTLVRCAPDVSRTNRALMRAANQAQSVPVDMRG